MLKAILFDLGDTLFDFEPMDSRAVFRQAGQQAYDFLLKQGCKLPPFERYFRRHHWAVRWSYLMSKLRRREFNSFTLLKTLARKMNLSLDDQTLRQLAWEWYQPITEHSKVADDVIPTLTRFRDRGFKLAIVSNTFIPGFILDRHMAMHGIKDFFPVRIYSSETGYRKPHRRIFEMALEAVGVEASEAIFIGDVIKTDIVGAHGVGMTAVLRQPFANSRTHAVADHVIRSLTDLQQLLPIFGAVETSEMANVGGGELACE